MATTDQQLKVRLPPDLKAFVAREAQANGASQNSEVVRALRERMDRLAVEKTASEHRA